MKPRVLSLVKSTLENKQFDMSILNCPSSIKHTDRLAKIQKMYGSRVSNDAMAHVEHKILNREALQRCALTYLEKLIADEPTTEDINRCCVQAFKRQHLRARRYLWDKEQGHWIDKVKDRGF